MSGKKAIYETKGRAKEFCPLAMNHYSGCGHGCTYCYAPGIAYRQRADFHERPVARLTPVDIERSAKSWAKRRDEEYFDLDTVLLCFMTDPYQPIEEEMRLTRQAIQILHRYDIPVTILTKAGALAGRDFDLLTPADSFATTLTTPCLFDKNRFEPRAGSHRERLRNLQRAKDMGIQTWASLEPVIDRSETLRCILGAHELVGHFKIGKMNYGNRYADSYWRKFAEDAIAQCERLGVRYYIKKDLAAFLGRTEGFWSGV